jgi:hypothetical protein
MLSAALFYAARGWPVFPIKPGTKRPHGILVPRGCLDASTAADRIHAWWSRSSLAGVGIACGYPGPDVIDFDVTAGKPGHRTYARLAAAGLMAGAQLVVETPSGGRHMYYRGTDQGNGSMARHGVDFRGRGGYVVAPPTIIDGKAYTVLRTDPHSDASIDFAAARRVLDPPRPVRTPQRPADANHDALIQHVALLGEGNRNAGLFWASCRAAEGGADEDVYRALVDAAVTAGLGEREAARTVESARRRAGVR